MYKSQEGAAKAALQAENRAKLKGLKQRANELAALINSVTREIAELKAQAEQRKAQRLQLEGEGQQVSMQHHAAVVGDMIASALAVLPTIGMAQLISCQG